MYVEDIDGVLARVPEAAGEVTTKPYPEGDLWVAMTRDPAGNAIGVWQHGPGRACPEDRRGHAGAKSSTASSRGRANRLRLRRRT